MKKLLCLFLAVLALSGCTVINRGNEFYTSFTDDTGYEVVLPVKPGKVAVLFSSYAEVWTLAGGEVAITVQETIDRKLCNEDVIVVDSKSGHTHIDTEALIAARPDFVIATSGYQVQVDAVNLCREAGIPAALFTVESYNDFACMLSNFTSITQKHEIYESYINSMNSHINTIFKTISVNEVNGGKILFVQAGSSPRSTKAKTKAENFVCHMLYQLNTFNIAENAPVLLDGLSLEEIIEQDPGRIFISTMGDEAAAKEYVTSLLKTDGWNSLTAVKSGNVHFLPKDLFHYKPNQRWADAYSYLASILYPELFHD